MAPIERIQIELIDLQEAQLAKAFLRRHRRYCLVLISAPSITAFLSTGLSVNQLLASYQYSLSNPTRKNGEPIPSTGKGSRVMETATDPEKVRYLYT